ncbi:hypothetical protein [Phenylobacterium sp. SCN 70-31]|uniref:hypothetical protein n=1 Tax=Phenylobacterium sp. SCN 70-31 TaxID=1660129 RepID=UPI00086C8703|nr:hypothetical protein [Phenylobacterium sp. SCN 70-31]ODT85731.1 MAG: hypothetical protein ABS78_19395 [Phenylobacterium sp. SCN 70-31]
MSGIETRFGIEDDADRIRRAFYGFVGANAADADGPAQFRTEFSERGPQVLVRLWSAEAMEAFLQQVPGGRPDRRRCYE